MIYVITINDKEYEVEVEVGKANILKTTLITAPAAAVSPVAAVSPAPVSAAAAPVLASGSEVVKAPMPGTILEIKVIPGSAVKKGEVLLILEAMKMENEILASSDGVIKQVVVTKGAIVSTGDVLVVIQ